MGNPCAPPVAIIYLDKFERDAMQLMPQKPDLLLRYIDDYAGIWSHGEAALLNFLDRLNALHPTIKFTLDYSGVGGSVAFLDTLVSVETMDGRTALETELFIKPMNSGILLHYQSAHPTSTKHNMARNQFIRAISLSSSASKEKTSISKIWDILEKNGYPRKLLRRLLREAKDIGRYRRSETRREKRADGVDGFLTLPYVDEALLCKVKRIVKRSGLKVKIAWRNDKKLKKMLVKSAISPPVCPSGGRRCHCCECGLKGMCTNKNLVYRIRCKLCTDENVIYIGETKRPIRLRFNEHIRDIRHKTLDSPLGDHFRQKHADVNLTRTDDLPLEISIVCQTKDHPDRKISESLSIREETPVLNTNIASWPVL